MIQQNCIHTQLYERMRIIPILPNQEPAILLDISPFHHQFLRGIPNQRELVAKKVPWFHQKQMAQAPSPPWNSSINGCLLLLVRGTRSMVQKHLCILYMYISHIGLYMSCQLIIYVTTLKPYNRLKKKTESRIKIQHLQHVRISPTTRFGQILLCIRHCGQQIPNHTAIRSSHIATGPTRETTWPVRLPASTQQLLTYEIFKRPEKVPRTPGGIGYSTTPMAVFDHDPSPRLVEEIGPLIQVLVVRKLKAGTRTSRKLCIYCLKDSLTN